MLLRRTANVTLAIRPFTSVCQMEIQSLAVDRCHPGFRADCRYYDAHPNMSFAIRRALSELDWLADFGDCPPPPLYVLVNKCENHMHTVEGIFRGTPFWKQAYCGQFAYADVRSNAEAWELMLACRRLGGMDEAARVQFDKHSQFVSRMRALAGTAILGRAN